MPRIEPLASCAVTITDANINEKRMRARVEKRVQDMMSPLRARINSEGNRRVTGRGAERFAEQCRKAHPSHARPESYSADLEKQVWYSTRGQTSSVIGLRLF